MSRAVSRVLTIAVPPIVIHCMRAGPHIMSQHIVIPHIVPTFGKARLIIEVGRNITHHHLAI